MTFIQLITFRRKYLFQFTFLHKKYEVLFQSFKHFRLTALWKKIQFSHEYVIMYYIQSGKAVQNSLKSTYIACTTVDRHQLYLNQPRKCDRCFKLPSTWKNTGRYSCTHTHTGIFRHKYQVKWQILTTAGWCYSIMQAWLTGTEEDPTLSRLQLCWARGLAAETRQWAPTGCHWLWSWPSPGHSYPECTAAAGTAVTVTQEDREQRNRTIDSCDDSDFVWLYSICCHHVKPFREIKPICPQTDTHVFLLNNGV